MYYIYHRSETNEIKWWLQTSRLDSDSKYSTTFFMNFSIVLMIQFIRPVGNLIIFRWSEKLSLYGTSLLEWVIVYLV